MEWKISDGTVVHLGGEIEGDGPVAQRLLEDLQRMADGVLVYVGVRPEPAGSEPLDLDSALHVNAWVFGAALRESATVESAPEIEFPETESEEGVVY